MMTGVQKRGGMKVLHVLPAFDGGGAEEDTLRLVTFLKKQRDIVPEVASSGGRLVDALAAHKIDHHTLPLRRKAPWHLWANAGRLAALCQSQGIDIMHVHSRAPAWSCLWAARHLNIPWISTFHGAYGVSGLFKKYYNRIMLRATHTIAISAFIYEHISKTYGVGGEAISVIERGVDVDDAPSSLSMAKARALLTWGLKDTVLLLPGRFSPVKGQHLVLSVLKDLVKEHPSLKLVCVGLQKDTPYTRSLRKHIQAYGLDNHVSLLPYAEDMKPFYRAASWVLVPTRKPEGFGLVAAEASAMGTPVVGFADGALCELIQDGKSGFLVTKGTSEEACRQAFAQVLVKALALSLQKRVAMGQKARAHMVSHFNIHTCHDKTYRLYQQLKASASR